MTMTENQPVYRTATIRKLKRTHEDTNFETDFMRTSTLKPRQLSRPILRSASVIKTRHIKENLCNYGSYTDDQPENLIFRRGQLKLIVCGSDDRLSVTIVDGRSLPACKQGTTAWIEVHLLPGGQNGRISQSSARVPAHQPEFDETFTFEINERPQPGSKLFISLFFETNRNPEFIGCMSFGVRKIMQEKSVTSGWYYLLSETLGRRKHLVVSKAPQNDQFQRREISAWSNSTSSSSSSNFDIDTTMRKNVRWGRETVFNLTPIKSSPQSNGFDSLHGQDIAALKKKTAELQREQESQLALKVQRGWCGFGFTLVGENPVQVETVFNDCVGDQAGLVPGDVIVAANSTELLGASGKEVQKTILGVVADLHLNIIRRSMKPKVGRRRRPTRSEVCQSPAKISCRYDYSDSETSTSDDFDEEISSKASQMTLNPRLKGMQSLLKFDSGIHRVSLIQDGRDFVYSGSCLVRISGMADLQRVWVVLLSDLLLICVYDPDEEVYVVIEEVVQLRDCSLSYEAIRPDGTPDLTWMVNVADQKDFGPRRYTFEADTAELAAMWKCCLSRQIDLTKQNKTKPASFSSPAPLRTKSEADMNRLFDQDSNQPQNEPSTSTERHGIKNRRKSLGAGRLDFGVAELMSRARESIRNRRRSSFATASSYNNNSCGNNIRSSSPRPVETLAEEENSDVFAFGLKSGQDVSFDQLSPIKASKKLSTSSMLKKNVSNSTLTSKNSESDSLAASSLESQCSAESDSRKSIPERVNFAATWVSARLLKKHRERRARRALEEEENTLNPAADRDGATTVSATSIVSAVGLLTPDHVETCRSGLPAVIGNEACLAAFREFLKKEHSDENLEFWLEAERFKNASDSDRIDIAATILETYIRFGACQEVNINSEMNRQVTAGLEEVPPSAECLVDAQEHVFKLMQTDTYSRFVKSLP